MSMAQYELVYICKACGHRWTDTHYREAPAACPECGAENEPKDTRSLKCD